MMAFAQTTHSHCTYSTCCLRRIHSLEFPFRLGLCFENGQSCFGVGFHDVPERSVFQHPPQSRHVWLWIVRESLHTAGAAKVDHNPFMVDARKTAASFHVFAASDAGWRLVLIADCVFDAHASSFVSSWLTKLDSKEGGTRKRRERQRKKIAGYTTSSITVEVTTPPIIGVAMRFITSAPAP